MAWLRKLIEDEGVPSLRRAAFAYSLVLVSIVLIAHCFDPTIITKEVVDVVEKTFFCVSGIFGLHVIKGGGKP